MSFLQLPPIPVPHAELPGYLAEHWDRPMTELFEPYRKYETRVRELYAQEPGHPSLKDPHFNVLPVFTEDTSKIRIRARDLKAESGDEKSKYIMPLPDDNRRPKGAAATVASIDDFRSNFSVFSESSLADLNWDNVVAAGSSVVSCLLPVPQEYSKSRRSLRQYYHEKFCPASDVDLFLYGLTEEQAVEKIKQIEASVRDSILAETTTVRTKHAVTICSEYPTRHVQIVLRIYKSVSEILAGFDIDCSGAAYDGKQVYCTPRALQSYMTQVNHIDLSRRSPSYENRLSKYSHRNFEIYWAELDRSRIDPTIFERSFHRTLGLSRLLVLERLPTADSRQSYAAKRRRERGRPPLNNNIYSRPGALRGNIKETFEDEVAEWVSQEDVNNYDTFVLPYGRRYHARKIEKLCYTRDLLLNAEWNQKKDREVYLHRHPAFFGRVEDVINDCCGFCPVPKSEKEKEVAEEESKTFISGKISFLTDDPGRQQIGSFNPLTDDDWTEMAYVGNTARLCQAIVDGDLEHVEDWLDQEGADPNRRDHTGRTPLQLAVISSTPDIVKCLVEKGARLIARVADGRTALHLAAQRGDAEIVKILMDKSTANEAEEAEKEEQRRQAKVQGAKERSKKSEDEEDESQNESDDEDEDEGEMIDDESSDNGAYSATTASFVKVKGKKDKQTEETDAALNENDGEPDFYDINIIAWDRPCSALHFAIIEGHDDVVKLLCQEYGADVLLPVKFLGYNNQPTSALLTLALALALPVEKAKKMASTLLSLGATSSQADLKGITAFHRYVESSEVELIDLLLDLDKTGSSNALKHISFPTSYYTTSPLLAAIGAGDVKMTLKLLDAGIATQIDFDIWLKSAKTAATVNLTTYENNLNVFNSRTEQPLIAALQGPNPAVALDLLERGANPDTKTKESYSMRMYNSFINRTNTPACALDIVRNNLEFLRKYDGEKPPFQKPFKRAENPEAFMKTLSEGTWMHLAASEDLKTVNDLYATSEKAYEVQMELVRASGALEAKKRAIAEMIQVLEKIESKILDKNEPPAAKEEDRHVSKFGEFTTDYRFIPQFTGDTDITEIRRQAYIQLFEAAWRGDLETVKRLTLTAWGEKRDQPPLKVAISDRQKNNPFSLAFLRGHYKVAAAVLEIAQAQFAPEDGRKIRYEMQEDSDMEEEDSEDEDEHGMYRMIVDDDKFTIDNVGEVNMQVKGTVKPLQLLGWPCANFVMRDGRVVDYQSALESLFQFVFKQNDHRGLSFLLDTADHFINLSLDDQDGTESRFYTLTEEDFKGAVREGHPDMLAEVIKRTGAGLPLEELVKDTGVELQVKPRYYQGLTVYGKKRSDWAEAGRQTVSRSFGMKISPLLYAATVGSLESVEWFLSDAPLRCYLEFTKSKAARDDPRLNHLSQAPGGFDGAISQWLTKHHDLVLLAAVSCRNRRKVLALVKYLIKAFPNSISVKHTSGYTPLFLATLIGRVDIVRLLIENGADQTSRQEGTYENLLHAALRYNPQAPQLRTLLDVLDPEARAHMFCGRSHHSAVSEGRTPLHHWLERCISFVHDGKYGAGQVYKSLDEVLAVLRLLLEYSGGSELNHADSAGDTLLHTLVSMTADSRIICALLDANAQQARDQLQNAVLLRRENAVGMTPAEMARDRFLAAFITEPQDSSVPPGVQPVRNWPQIPTAQFVARDGEAEPIQTRVYTKRSDAVRRAQNVLHLLSEYLEQFPGKRRLVSLNEANDVAKRIGDGFQKQRYGTKVDRPKKTTDDGESDKGAASRDSPRRKATSLAFLPDDMMFTSWNRKNN